MQRLLVAAAALGVFAATIAPDVAEARDRERRVERTTTGPKGERTAVTDRARSPGRLESNTTVTGPNGQTGQRQRVRTRGDGAVTDQRTVTFPDGSTASGSKTVTRTEDGFAATATRTNRAGETIERSAQATVERTETGRVVTGTATGPAGESTFNRSIERGEDTRTKQTSVTGPEGQTRSVLTETARTAPGVFEQTTTVTGRNGETRTRESTVTVSPPAPQD